MEQGTILDRRTFEDRRIGDAATYTGPERRKLGDRRSAIIAACIHCGEVCGAKRGWVKSPLPKAYVRDFQIDVCDDCYSKRLTHSHGNNQAIQ